MKKAVLKTFATITGKLICWSFFLINIVSPIFKKDYVESLCGFRKAHSTQHALLKLLQSWQEELDKKGMVAIILMDLSKTYDCIPHDLLIAKLNAYGIDSVGFLLISDYLSCRKQRTKIGSSYSKKSSTRVFTWAPTLHIYK